PYFKRTSFASLQPFGYSTKKHLSRPNLRLISSFKALPGSSLSVNKIICVLSSKYCQQLSKYFNCWEPVPAPFGTDTQLLIPASTKLKQSISPSTIIAVVSPCKASIL